MNTEVNENNHLIVYHANCIDGITAAAVVYKYLTQKSSIAKKYIDSIAVDYATGFKTVTDLLKIKQINTMYIVDFSFTEKQLFFISNHVDDTYLFDHHKTAFENLCGDGYTVEEDSKEGFFLGNIASYNTSIILDNTESGASLVWKKLFNPTYKPKLISHVKDYDLYQFKLKSTKAINKYLKLQEKSMYRFLQLLTDFEVQELFERYVDAGNMLIDYEEKLENSIIEAGTTAITINGINGITVNAPSTLASSIGNKLAKKSGTFGSTWCQLSKGKIQFSLRSIGNNCDVSILAKSMGGGGHKNASGFVINSLVLWTDFNMEEIHDS